MTLQSPSPTEEAISELKEQIASGDAVLFVGSGVSIAATNNNPFASWIGLLRDGITWCDERTATEDGWAEAIRAALDRANTPEALIQIASQIMSCLGAPNGGEYRSWLARRVGNLRILHSEILDAIRELDLKVFTTNYDTLLEAALGRQSVTWRELSGMQSVFKGGRNDIIHVHGVWNMPETVVFGSDSYTAILGDSESQAFISSIASRHTIIFIGMGVGLSDPNFTSLRKIMARSLHSSSFHHFRLAQGSEIRALRSDHQQAERIQVLSYGESHSDLAPFLRRLMPPKRSLVDNISLFNHRDEEWYDHESVDRLDKLLSKPKSSFTTATPAWRDEVTALEARLIATKSPQIGDCIVGVQLTTQIGSGSFAEVWEGIDQVSGTKRAVKIFLHNRFRFHQSMSQFRKGVDILIRLTTTPGRPSTIIQVHRTDRSRLAFSMDHIGGGDLASVSPSERGWSDSIIVTVFLAICGAIRFAHEAGYIHKDIKPANILMGPRLTPVLTDFDIAEARGVATTLVTQGMGTLKYSAPEQLDGKPISPATDIYSLGRLLHYMITSCDPPMVFEPVQSLRDLDRFPRYIIEAIRRSTNYSPSRRFKSVADLVDFILLGSSASDLIADPAVLPIGMSRGPVDDGYFWQPYPELDFFIEMVYVSPGPFLMGSMDGMSNERPIHVREIPYGYFISKYPVSWGQYKVFCDVTSRALRLPDRFKLVDDHPAVQVNWSDAGEFCSWAGLSLPREAEWEKAARGIGGAIYPWGDAGPTSHLCNFNGNAVYGDKGTSPVAAFPDGVSSFGMADAVGNVWQWCEEAYVENAYGLYEDGIETTKDSVNPDSPRVCRGGSWVHGLPAVRCSNRTNLPVVYRADDIGIRPVKRLEP